MKRKIHNILACVDLSEYSLMTLEYALEIANRTQSQVIALNVINQRDVLGVEMAYGYFPGYIPTEMNMDEYVEAFKVRRHEELESFINENFKNENSLINLKVDMGIPNECILETIETQNIDLVVMGNKGRGNVSRFLFGSVAEKVFRHSPVPVVSVRGK